MGCLPGSLILVPETRLHVALDVRYHAVAGVGLDPPYQLAVETEARVSGGYVMFQTHKPTGAKHAAAHETPVAAVTEWNRFTIRRLVHPSLERGIAELDRCAFLALRHNDNTDRGLRRGDCASDATDCYFAK